MRLKIRENFKKSQPQPKIYWILEKKVKQNLKLRETYDNTEVAPVCKFHLFHLQFHNPLVVVNSASKKNMLCPR